MKFTIVRAGSSYTPELIEEMAARREKLPVKELMLYDIDEQRLDIMSGFSKRYAKKHGLNIDIKSTMNLDEAVYGADLPDNGVP